jgi:hypothetical protein
MSQGVPQSGLRGPRVCGLTDPSRRAARRRPAVEELALQPLACGRAGGRDLMAAWRSDRC